MAMSAFFAVLASSAESSSPRAQPSSPPVKVEPPSLDCGGCGAPLRWAGAACSYCQRGARQASFERLRSTFRLAEEDQLQAHETLRAIDLGRYTLGVDPGCPDGDKTATITITDGTFDSAAPGGIAFTDSSCEPGGIAFTDSSCEPGSAP